MTKTATKSNKKETDAFNRLKDVISGYDFKWLAGEANVCAATLYKWCDGTIEHPRFTTLVKVATAVGYKLTLARHGAPVLTVVK